MAHKRIVIISQFYPPEVNAGSNRVRAIAHALADAGEDVTVVTGRPSFPDGVIPLEYRDGATTPDERDGSICIRRVWTYASPRLRTIDRLLNWLSVAVGATLYLLTHPKPIDVVLVSSPPITLALPALAAVARHRARLVLDIRDVYPEMAIKLGVWRRDGPVARIVAALSEALYRRASLIFAMTPTAATEILSHGAPPQAVMVVPNGYDRVSAVSDGPVRRDNGEFIIAYAGNMGVATGTDVILDAAQLLRPVDAYRFVLAGGGAGCGDLQRRIERDGLRNVTMLGTQPREIAIALVRDADVCLVPLRRGVDDSLPTKLFDALAQGTPVIVCADGEPKAFVERSGGGVVVPPEDGAALAEAIRDLATDSAKCDALGRAGMAYVQTHYDRARVVSDIARRVGALPSA